MLRVVQFNVLGSVILLAGLASSPAVAADIMDARQCQMAIADAREAIEDNPTLGEKVEKVLLEVMALAQKRCEEKQFSNAKDLLDLARGMVSAESGSETK
jgi:hypothetical protein